MSRSRSAGLVLSDRTNYGLVLIVVCHMSILYALYFAAQKSGRRIVA